MRIADGTRHISAPMEQKLRFGSVEPSPPTCHGQVGFDYSSPCGENQKTGTQMGTRFLVPLTGLEPVQYRYRGILSPLCLPIPPQRRLRMYDSILLNYRQECFLIYPYDGSMAGKNNVKNIAFEHFIRGHIACGML